MRTIDYVVIGLALLLLGSMYVASYPQQLIIIWSKFKKLFKKEEK